MESTVKTLFSDFCKSKEVDIIMLPQSGSSRKNYIGVFGKKKYIITDNDNTRENEAFFYFTELFTSLQLNTPQILLIDSTRKIYIQNYLGDHTLSEYISQHNGPQLIASLAKQSLLKLFELQTKSIDNVDYSRSLDYEVYDELAIRHDLYYFKNFIVDVLDINYHKAKLLKEFETIATQLAQLQPRVLMIRDFQARNIMIDENKNVQFIDYQGAMLGPAMYDVVSFLYQAKANFSTEFRQEMTNYYINLWEDSDIKNRLKASLNPIILIRYLQVLGAYGLRGLIQRKPHFLLSLDQGIKNINNLVTTWEDLQEYPELTSVIRTLENPEIQHKIKTIITP